MTLDEALRVVAQRRNWLRERIAAKRRVNWDVAWDEREHEALSCIVAHHWPDEEVE